MKFARFALYMTVYSTLSKSSVVGTESIIEPLNSPQHLQEHSLVAPNELFDTYPFVDYKIGSVVMVTLKLN